MGKRAKKSDERDGDIKIIERRERGEPEERAGSEVFFYYIKTNKSNHTQKTPPRARSKKKLFVLRLVKKLVLLHIFIALYENGKTENFVFCHSFNHSSRS